MRTQGGDDAAEPAPRSVLDEVRRRHGRIVGVFLWALLALVVGSIGLRAAVLDWTDRPLWYLLPNVVFAGVIVLGLALVHRLRIEAAVVAVIAAGLVGVAVTAVEARLASGGSATTLLFVPLVLAGLLLGRGALYATAAVSVAIVLLPPLGREAEFVGMQGAVNWPRVVQSVAVLGIVAVFLDRFGSASRDALRTSLEREAVLGEEMRERRAVESRLRYAKDEITALSEVLADRLDHIVALREIDRAITGGFDRDHTLRVVVEQVLGRLGVDAGRILLFSAHDETLRLGAAAGLREPAPPALGLRLGEGHAGAAALARERSILDGRDGMAIEFGPAERVEERSFFGYAAVPLVAQGQLHGVLELFHRGPLTASPAWLASLDGLATQAAIALSSVTLLADLERSNAELSLAYDATIEGWARALDLRDHETEGHSRRVTDATLRLAHLLGVPAAELVHVRRGALLHDIGKMGVPDAILLKPARLTPEEWAVMQRHPEFAYELLEPIEFLRPALDIPYAHHERWDGAGYPRGLAGEEIPLAARIFAVADVFDALTSDRPYWRARSRTEAIDHIRAQAGLQFDPRVVEEFLQGVDRAEPPHTWS
jgi:HD-GYP domain-containing protein (c-di-GMP phosphodiesterase class II)